MSTDIKLDQHGGNWLLLEGSVVKCTATDFMLDSPGRRVAGGSEHRRALVHDGGDSLTINFGHDYSGGVSVVGDLAVSGDVTLRGAPVALGVMVDSLHTRIHELEQTIGALVALVGAVFVPPWRNKQEVEEGDDMGMSTPPASDLGLIVEFDFDRQRPGFGHEDVISIEPPAGTPVRSGSTVRVLLNLEG